MGLKRVQKSHTGNAKRERVHCSEREAHPDNDVPLALCSMHSLTLRVPSVAPLDQLLWKTKNRRFFWEEAPVLLQICSCFS